MFKLATKLRPSRTSLELAKRCGYAAAEFWTSWKSLEERISLGSIAKEFPLEYVIHFPNKPDSPDADLNGIAELYRELNCRAMVIHEPMFELYGRALIELEPTLRLGIENHRLDQRQFRAWADRYEWLTLDVEHLWMLTLAGKPLSSLEGHLKSFLDEYASKLIHVHLPGYLPGHEEHRPMYCSRDMVMMVLSHLHEAEFDGLVVSEVNPEFQNEIELKMDVLLVERWQQLAESELFKDRSINSCFTPARPAGERAG